MIKRSSISSVKMLISTFLIILITIIAYFYGRTTGYNEFVRHRYEREYVQMSEIVKKMNNPTLRISHNSLRYVTVKGIVSNDEYLLLKQLVQEQFGDTYPFRFRIEVDVKK